MLALVKTAPGPGLALLRVPDPAAGPGEVLLRVGAAGVCGSDVARFVWTRNYEAGGAKAMTADLPRIMGHEFAGTVEAVGDGVDIVRPGDRVAVQNILGCWHCPECLSGFPNLCRERRTLGVHRDGGYADLCVVPARNCTPIPDSVSMHLAAALQPYAVGSYAVGHLALDAGDAVAVWGLGPIGLAAVHAIRLRGGTIALGLDRNPVRLAEAESLGIPTLDTSGLETTAALGEALVARLGRRSLEGVVEAAGVPEAIEASLPVLRKRHGIVLIGNQRGRLDADLMPMIMDEQRLLGSRSYSLAAWETAVRTIVASGYERTLGDEVPLEEAIGRFEIAASGAGRPFTVVPRGAPE